MFEDALLECLGAGVDNIKFDCSVALSRIDPEGIHRLRVEIKRLKALFNLIGALNETFTVRQRFRRFRRLSGKTSRLRDAQVQKDLAARFGEALGLDLSDYTAFLSLRENEAWTVFGSIAEKKTLLRLNKSRGHLRKALRDLPPKTAETHSRRHLESQWKELQRINETGDLDDKALHRVRILSKEAHFTLEIVRISFGLFKDREDCSAALKKVHQCLGKWHDLEISRVYLEDFLSTSGRNTKGPELSGRLTEQVSREKEVLRTEFRNLFDEFVHLPPLE